MKQNPILITGGTGTTGSRIASRLIELGHRVRIASRKKGALADAEYVYFNWKDASSFTPALEQVKQIYLVAPGSGSLCAPLFKGGKASRCKACSDAKCVCCP